MHPVEAEEVEYKIKEGPWYSRERLTEASRPVHRVQIHYCRPVRVCHTEHSTEWETHGVWGTGWKNLASPYNKDLRTH